MYVKIHVQFHKLQRAAAVEAAEHAAAMAAATAAAAQQGTLRAAGETRKKTEDGTAKGSEEGRSQKKPKASGESSLHFGLSYGSSSSTVDYGFSDEDEVEEGVPSATSAPAPAPMKTEGIFVEEDKAKAASDFKRCFRNWVKYRVPWGRLFPDLTSFDLIEDLMQLDVGIVYLDIQKTEDHDRSKFGFIPLLASCSDGEIGALNAESFAERIISAVNLVMTDGRTLLDDATLDKLVVLRMNRDFMIFMRKHYFKEIKAQQPFNMTVVRPGEKEPGAESSSSGPSSSRSLAK